MAAFRELVLPKPLDMVKYHLDSFLSKVPQSVRGRLRHCILRPGMLYGWSCCCGCCVCCVGARLHTFAWLCCVHRGIYYFVVYHLQSHQKKYGTQLKTHRYTRTHINASKQYDMIEGDTIFIPCNYYHATLNLVSEKLQ